MREISPYRLWIGHRGDTGDLRQLFDSGIEAIVDLAIEEAPIVVSRAWVYCRLPLIDGEGNPGWLLQMAVEITANLLRQEKPTLVCCGAGMSRSPAIVAMALQCLNGRSSVECLADVGRNGPGDVSPGLWFELQAAIR